MRKSHPQKEAFIPLRSLKIGVVSNHYHLLFAPLCFEKSAFQENCSLSSEEGYGIYLV